MNDKIVKWNQIVAECNGYRAGFVSVFRRYEGQVTDEKDGQGRSVKVTAKSFARHNGVPDTTFRRWLGEQHPRGAAPGTTRTGQIARQAVKSDKVSTEDKVGMLNDLVSDKKVLKAFREQRAPKVTAADAKAAAAQAAAVVQPFLNGAGDMQAAAVWVGQLEGIAEGIAEQELSGAAIRKLDKAVGCVTEEIEVQKLREGMEVM